MIPLDQAYPLTESKYHFISLYSPAYVPQIKFCLTLETADSDPEN